MRTNALCCSAKDLYLHVASSFLALSLLINSPLIAQAQVTPPITSSGLNTTVTQNGNTYNITGGTRPSGGVNLFHSFGEFGVPANNIANFLNETPNLATSNILGRVTGGNVSNIFGTIQTTNFGSANLFLMNPAGFLFGPNATVNVGGMVAFTSADYLRLADGVRFNAIPNATADALLTPSPVAAFGFLGSNPGAITLQGSQFTVTEGQSIALVGGTITIESGTPEGGTAQPAQLVAPNGKILLASAASPGEFDATTLQALPNTDGASFTSFGSVSLAPGSLADVSGTGRISIRGGAFTLEVKEALLSTEAIPSPPGGDTLDSLSLTRGSAIVTATAGEEAGADVQLVVRSINLDGTSITSITTGDGAGGAITVTAEDSVSLTNGAQIVSQTQGNGIGGNITVEATSETGSVTISGYDLDGTLTGVVTPFLFNPLTGDYLVTSGIYSLTSGTKPGGNITITAPTVSLQDGAVIASVTSGDGRGGDVRISGNTVEVISGAEILSFAGEDFTPPDFALMGTGSGGDITISATDSVTVSGGNPDLFALSNIFSQTLNPNVNPTLGQGQGGMITVTAPNVFLSDAGTIASATQGRGNGGAINVAASNLLSISKFSEEFAVASGISTSASGAPSGNGGAINISGGAVKIEDGGLIASYATFDGKGGDIIFNNITDLTLSTGGAIASSSSGNGSSGLIKVEATGTVSISGYFANPDNPADVFWSTIRNVTNSNSGSNGGIDIHAGKLIMKDGPQIVPTGGGGQIESDTEAATGGTIRILADEFISMSSGANIINRKGSFDLGSISLTAPSITLSQSAIRGRTNIERDAGAITVNATNGDLTLSNDSHILTSTQQGAGTGGPATLQASGSIIMSGGSTVESSSFFPASGDGGTVTLTAGNQVTLSGQGTALLTTTGGRGNGGTITVNAQQVQITDGAIISAKSTGSGAAGSVTIEGPQSPAQSVLIDGAGSGLFTDTQGTGAGGNIAINANSVTLQNGGTLSAKTTGAGNAGNIQINTAALEVTTGGQITSSSAIGESGKTPTGSAGNVTVQGLSGPADSVLISGMDENYNPSGIFTDTQGTGAGGNINVTARSVTIQDGGTISASTSGTGPLATGGTIMLETESLRLDAGTITAGAFGDNTGQAGNVTITSKTIDAANFSFINTFTTGIGQAGNILLKATESITLLDSFVNSDAASFSMTEAGNGGFIHLNAPTIDLRSSLVSTTTLGAGNAGNILLEAQQLSLRTSEFGALNRQGTNILTLTQGPGQAGTITVRGLGGDSTIAGEVAISGASLLSSRTDNTGNAGSIMIDTLRLDLSDSGNITTGTQGTGAGGTITVHAHQIQLNNQATITATSSDTGNAGNVTIQGFASPAQSVLIDGAGSGFFTDTQGAGAGGNIFVNANSVTLQNGGTLSASTSGTAPSATGGTITVNANQVQLSNGGLITASSTGAGAGGSITIGAGSTFASNASTVSSTAAQAQGGDIAITAGQSATLANGSSISASSTGAGNAGNIMINAGQNYTSTDSAVTTQAAQASGGNITVLATDMVHLTNSQLNASVQGSSTTVGGNITIDPLYIILLNSQVLAQATQGQGGAISFTITNGGLYLPDATSTVSASSQFGVNGIVTIQSPNAPASGKIIPLSQKPLLATSLLNQRCAALAGGEFSSFTVAGRDSLPIEPGSWLASPLATLNAGTGLSAQGKGREGLTPGTSLADETTLLSLRQISPPGFLTQSFAVEGSTGCQS